MIEFVGKKPLQEEFLLDEMLQEDVDHAGKHFGHDILQQLGYKLKSDWVEDFLCLEEHHNELLDDRGYLPVLGDLVLEKEEKVIENAIVFAENKALQKLVKRA